MVDATVIGLTGIWAAVAVGTVATAIPRVIGVLLGARINPDGAFFRWVGCLAYGLLAALVSRMILLPIGPLANTDLMIRLVATGVGGLIFVLCRRNIGLGCIGGVVTFALMVAVDRLAG